MTTSPVMTVTDELLAELDGGVRVVWRDDGATVIAVDAITAELRRLRAENAELAQSLAESRANDQAAMGWLTSLRWASGDRGERMLPELVTHIESLAKDAGRLDLLDSLCEAYGFQDIHEGNRWVIDGPFRDIRAAADSLEAQ